MEQLSRALSLPIFANAPNRYLIAIGITLATFLLLVAVRRIVRRAYQRMMQTEKTELLEVPFESLSRTSIVFVVFVSAFAGVQALDMSERTAHVLDSVVGVVCFWQIGMWASTAAVGWFSRKRARSLTDDRALAGSIGILSLIARTLIWAVVALLTLDNLGVNVTTLIAGLGVGGIAVALAVQKVLGDLLASLAITLDKPFVIGDFLVVDDFLGSVENIGLKTTRLRSLSGEQIIISNTNLLDSRVRNYGRMVERRVLFTLQITYQTAPDLLQGIPPVVRRIVESKNSTRFDRCHFSTYGPYSLDFETVYYVLSADYNRYMDIQQEINLEIYREFSRLGIEFAYPTQTLQIDRGRTGRETGPKHG